MIKLISATWLTGIIAITAAPLPDDIAAALQATPTYDYGQPRQPLFVLEAYTGRATAQPEQRRALATAYLKLATAPGATAAARAFACKQLVLVGGAAEVPALAALLDQPEQSDYARLALQAMPAPEAGAALCAALDRLSGQPLIGAINSLGERRETTACAALAKLASRGDPQVRAAAIRALGMLGTPEAAAALPADAVEARLLCAERADGTTARAIYSALSAAPQPATRLAGLSGLARLDAAQATPPLIGLLHEADPLLGLRALHVLGQLPDAAVTAALTAELPRLDAPRQVALLSVLADRRATGARDAVTALSGSSDETIRAAALAALGLLGDAGSVPTLLRAAAEYKGAAKSAAESALAQLAAPGVDDALIHAIPAGAAGERGAAINAAAARMLTSATPALLAAARDGDTLVRTAAARALGKIGTAGAYPRLVALLGDVQSEVLESAIAAVGHRVSEPPARIAPLLALLQQSGATPAAQAAVLRTLAGIGGSAALAVVRERLNAGDSALRDAAVRALAAWPDSTALDDLQALVTSSTNSVHKALAMRGLFHLAPTAAGGADRFKAVLDAMQTADEKRQWLGALGTRPDPGGFPLAAKLLEDPAVKNEAALALAQIGRALLEKAPAEVAAAMKTVLAAVPDSAAAQAVLAEAQQTLGIKSAFSEARRKELAAKLPAGAQLAAYLDCGVERQDQAADGVTLRGVHGGNWAWKGAAENPAALTVTFASGHIDFEAGGLNPQRHYQVGFTWWDYDANGREQSVWINGKNVLAKTALPAWQGKQQGPATVIVAAPPDATTKGKITIEFRGEGAGNVVCSEIWLIESAAPLPTVTAPATSLALPAPHATQPEVRANAGAQKKILIVTGCDYPGHKWQQTTPVLTAALARDKRLEISVVEDANYLGAPELKRYDAVVLHYQNHQVPAPGPAALANFRQYVEGGHGLVMVHFACGAFIDWTTKIVSRDFLPIAGRVWNPRLRGHDPRGPFQVHITDHAHPVTSGLADFDTTDELYTCLEGDVPVRVLAQATSKVDQKDYPMAFVLEPGQGRVFHCVLGHDVQAFNTAVGTLYRRGAAWAAGLAPGD